MRRSTILLYAAPLLLATTALTSPAFSAEPAATPSAIQEVIVTAQKREQNVQDVPISMTVVSGRQIEAFHDRDLHSLQAMIPNLYIERLNWADTIYLRGFGSPPANFAFDPTVSMYVDGVYSGRPQQFTAPFFDIERVEVLRGPQGALFGKNTAAGAISIITANPTPTFQGSGTAAYNFDLEGTELSGYVSGPVSETLSLRIAGRFLDQDGYIPNVVSGKKSPGREERLVRVGFLYNPGSGFGLTGKLQYARVEGRGENQVMAPLTVSGSATSSQGNDPNPFGFPYASEFTGWNASLTGNVALGDHTLTFVSGYASFDADRATSYSRDVPAIFLNRSLEAFEQFSQEVRIASPEARRFNYILGAYFDHGDYHLETPWNYNLLGGVLAGAINPVFDQEAKTVSVFGQATFNATDVLRLIGSLRYSHQEKEATYTTTTVSGFALRGPSAAAGSLDEDHFDPSITVQYDLAPAVMLYALYARGSKSGGFVSNTPGVVNSNFAFEPEKAESFEAGIKSAFAEGRVVANVSVYDTTIRNLQTSVFCPTCAGGGFVTKNAGSASSRGVEAELAFEPVETLRFSLSGAYQDAEYDDFKGANCLARQAASVCSVTAPLGAPNNPANNNLAGEPLAYASKWTGNFQVQHRLPLSGDLEVASTFRAAYRSRFYNSDDQSLVYGVQKGFVKLDLRVELRDPDRWSIALVGKNLTDEDTYSFANAWPAPLSNFPTAHKYLDEPRTMTIEGTVHF